MTWLSPDRPALVLAPMEGVLDAPARAVLTESGAFSWCVSEFVRVGRHPIPRRRVLELVPELARGGMTAAGTPVQLQLLGNEPEALSETAWLAAEAGAGAIDLNFGCPGPLVTGRGGGAALLRDPPRIERIVRAVREALPRAIPVSAKVRLGWESPDELDGILDCVLSGGADWITVHARTRAQHYRPHAQWEYLGRARERSPVPVVANGDLFSVTDLRRCREISGCRHFMTGRGVLRDPALPALLARELGLPLRPGAPTESFAADPQRWLPLLERFSRIGELHAPGSRYALSRLKQWVAMARTQGLDAPWMARFKHAETVDEALALLSD